MAWVERAVEEAIFGREIIEVNIRVKKKEAETIEGIAESVDSLLRGSWLRRLWTKYRLIDAFSLPSLDMHYITVRVRADLLNALRQLPFIEAISENITVSFEPPPNTGIVTTLGKTTDYIKANKAHEVGLTGKGVVGAVLDTGSARRHAMLKGKYVAEQLCFKYSYPSPEMTPEALHPHGPWVASCFAGREVQDAKLGRLVGVCPDAQIVNAKVFGKSGSTTLNIIFKGIDFAVQQKSDILLASWGSDRCSQDLHDVLNRAMEKLPKLVCSISTGNSGWKGGPFGPNWGGVQYNSMSCPGHMENVLTSGAIATLNPWPDYIAAFQSRGPPSHFIDPPGGSQRWRLYDRGRLRYPRWIAMEDAERIMGAALGFAYIGYRGSSMGQPHGAGCAGIEKQMHPEHSRTQILEAIWNSCRPLGPIVPNDDSGFGCPDIEKMIR